MPTPTLKGQHVVVVGGSAGIGLAVAEAALEDGARVTVVSSQAGNVEAAVSALGAAAGQGQVAGAVLDVRDEVACAALFERLGALDHLVFTAGDWGAFMAPRPLAETDLDALAAALGVRFWGALRVIKHAAPHIPEGGSITLTDGVLAHRPNKGGAITSAFAGALEHLARGLAVDLAPVRVNAVCPGLTLTERWANPRPELLAQLAQRQLIPRGAQPHEVAQAYLYLMRGTYTTGQVMVVDGGRLLT
ncbi:SDR family oxidoreductase [Caulobacter sp. KR2-114]|uniref:SDR family oxidoreductase n=1 Tax=Caulobacter sp. KR2-114 TaxID=3400912 RepID=UPI003C1142DC